jgi:hypothetical protein
MACCPFSFPMATTMAILAWGMDTFKDAYVKAGQLQEGMSALKWGADYLAACHESSVRCDNLP